MKMPEPITRGNLVRPEARIPQSLLSSTNRFSKSARLLKSNQVAHWNVDNQKLLSTFRVKIVGIEEMTIREATRKEGPLELALSQKTTLAAALPALAVALKGRGDLLDIASEKRKELKTQFKETADLRAAATELEVLYSIVEENANIAFLVKVGEGGGDAGRRKPGETLNASLYPGQLIVNSGYAGHSIEKLKGLGVKIYEIATDPIDGTGNTTESKANAITSMLVVDGEIKKVPDVYMEKLTVDQLTAKSGVDTSEGFEKIIQAISDSHQITPQQINAFALKRDRHPIDELLGRGINMIVDSDCDLLPAAAPGAQPGVYDNGLPMHAMIGNTGGAAEYLIGAAANAWLGGESHGRFVSADGMKKAGKEGWKGRYDFTPEDVSVIEGAGFKLNTNYPISQLVGLNDGIAAFGGITSNAHFPQLSAVYLGENYAQVDVMLVRASGTLTKRRITFAFDDSLQQTIEHFNPVTEVLMNCDLRDIRGELRKIFEDQGRAERLRREISLSLYQVFEMTDGKFAVNETKLRELGDERTQNIINSLRDLKPDWFVA
jgi:fructose-1,6-bisphosphatase/sedoheptulose 1,7-bisphosphatase-like protein